VLEEMIVTAQKQEQSIQDVPISMVAFNSDMLEKLGVQDVKDMAAKVPNLYIKEFPSGGGTTVQLYIRGVGQNDVQITQDPLPPAMDGVYIGSPWARHRNGRPCAHAARSAGHPVRQERIGGAINLVTNQADPSALGSNSGSRRQSDLFGVVPSSTCPLPIPPRSRSLMSNKGRLG
jgi:iron complex outermembrane receptor protein